MKTLYFDVNKTGNCTIEGDPFCAKRLGDTICSSNLDWPKLSCFYVTLVHKDQLSKVPFIGVNGSIGWLKSTHFYCSVPIKLVKLQTKASKSIKTSESYFGFKVINPEN